MKNDTIKLGIIGLGLIGASILEALSPNKNYKIYCVSSSSKEKAKNLCYKISDNLEIIKNCDIVFVCSKASKTLEILSELNSLLNKDTVVADVTSFKKGLLENNYNFEFILSHPMAGSEKSGFKARDKNLFKNARWLIEKENNILNKIILDLGAMPILTDMKNHDLLCAQISHLPTILSFLLFDCAEDKAKKIASSGFRDTTRLAMTSADLAFSMYKNNEESILKSFTILQEKLNHLKNLSDSEKIKLFEKISEKRSKMYDKNGKNIF